MKRSPIACIALILALACSRSTYNPADPTSSEGILFSALMCLTGGCPTYEEDTARFAAMTGAGYVYIPGGWDVDGDGSTESGFYVMKYAASSSGTLLDSTASTSDVPHNGSSLDCKKLSDGTLGSDNRVYNPITQRFNGTDATSANYACDGSSGTLSQQLTAVAIAGSSVAAPLTNLNWFQARAGCRSINVAGGVRVDLITPKQWVQIAQLVINRPENWTGGAVGSGTLVRGHSDNVPAQALAPSSNDTDGFAGTSNSLASGPDQRRTFFVGDGVSVRACSAPGTCDSAHPVNGDQTTTGVRPGYRTVLWDFSGNVFHLGRALIHKDHRYNGGAALNLEFSASSVPTWLRPTLSSGTLLGSSVYAGQYTDGLSTAGASDNDNVGYLTGTNVSLYAAYGLGRPFSGDQLAGAFSASLAAGPGATGTNIGFRCASR